MGCRACLESRGIRGFTPMLLAAWHGQHESLRLLLDSKADPHARSKVCHRILFRSIFVQNGFTALSLAAYFGSKESAKLLIEHKCDVNERSDEGLTALMCAAVYHQSELVSFLREFGKADVGIENSVHLSMFGCVHLSAARLQSSCHDIRRTC